jgi:iron(III) transport system permease protein
MRLIFILFALLFAAPLFYLVIAAFHGTSPYFISLYHHGLLHDYLYGSFIIGIGTTILATCIGTWAAWLVTFHRFPLHRHLSWLLILPLATPSYIAAMFYGNALEGAGIVQMTLRDITGLAYGEYWFPSIRSHAGAIMVLSFTLYPYVYLLVRAAFLMQSQDTLHAAMLLGCHRRAVLWRILLPMARPAIIAGASLVMMEALADFGVSALFGISTLTTGIYRTWHTMMDYSAAARLALMLGCLLLFFLWSEKTQRGTIPTAHSSSLSALLPHWSFSPMRRWCCTFVCLFPIALGFAIPLLLATCWSSGQFHSLTSTITLRATTDSLIIASSVALLTTVFGLATAYASRLHSTHRFARFLLSFITSAYGFSGSVIAISVLLTIFWIQHQLGTHLTIIGTYLAILWGCALRFLTIAHRNHHSALARISPALEESASLLGCNRWQIAWRVHLPLLRTSILSSVLLIFIDTLKELPATMLLRPFNTTTLAIRIYELAKDEMLGYAAPLALVLLVLSTVATLTLHTQLLGTTPRHADD